MAPFSTFPLDSSAGFSESLAMHLLNHRRPIRRFARSFLNVERLEDRTLLSSNPANVFAGFGGILSNPDGENVVPIHLTSGNISVQPKATLGFVLRPGPGSSFAPLPVGLESLAPGGVPIISQQVLPMAAAWSSGN